MYDLSRFLEAQKNSYDTALREIKAGRKRSHWMWYIFPQILGLGHSAMARHYAIRDLNEAREYLRHPVLGPRLVEISEVLLALDESDPRRVMGSPDDLKLRSCMTLFQSAAPDQPVFGKVLDKFYDGRPDGRTLEMLNRS